MIHIITVTIGRQLYLNRLIESLVMNDIELYDMKHHIIFNGCSPSNIYDNYNYVKHDWTDRCCIGEALNRTMSAINCQENDIIFKLDDDCLLQSFKFFDHMMAVLELKPDAVISPFPVGLIANFGGIQSNDRHVQYSALTDTYYTFRKVDHVGGFARICSAKYLKDFKFTRKTHDEDTEFSQNHQNLDFYYLENALIVEHQESSMGQKLRKF